MALDGITVAGIVSELKKTILGGHTDKIYQPQKDEIILSVRSGGKNVKLILSANPSHPRLHITKLQRDNPVTAPMFSMVLRKYLSSGKITDIRQPGLERIAIIDFEALNDLGDVTIRHLIIEIMGKYSNIILTDSEMKILDSIRHVSFEISSVREVLCGKEYVFPPSQGKKDLLCTSFAEFNSLFENAGGIKITPFIYQSYTGISPAMASEIAFRAGLDANGYIAELDEKEKALLFDSLMKISADIKNDNFSPTLIKDSENGRVVEFSPFCMEQYKTMCEIPYNSVSELLEDFYGEKDNAYHIQQKAHDMRRLVTVNIERCVKKKEMQAKTLRDISAMDSWRLKGELITANIYAVKKGMKKLEAVNYYDENKTVEITLDENLTPSENAQRYYNKYNKAKRTLSAIEIQKKTNDEELEYLESVLSAITASTEEADLDEIKNELVSQGFMKRKNVVKNRGAKIKKAKPLHFVSSDGYDIFVGKSNTQNDELTIHTAKSNDIWLHTKNIPGSHVIISTNDTGKAPDKTLEEAANLAAYFSKAKTGSGVPVDYTLRRFVKKPSGAKPGMVIYETNSTVFITPNEVLVQNMKKAD